MSILEDVSSGSQPNHALKLGLSLATKKHSPANSGTAGNVYSCPSVPPPLFATPIPYILKSAISFMAHTCTPFGTPPVSGPSITPAMYKSLHCPIPLVGLIIEKIKTSIVNTLSPFKKFKLFISQRLVIK